MSTIDKLFSKSPFGKLLKHMHIVKSCVELIIPFFEAAARNDKQVLEETAKAIFDLEDQADDVKNALRDKLPRSIFMPVDRNNLLEILDLQDSIADRAQDISIVYTLKDMQIPADILEDLRRYIDSSVKVCFLATKMTEEFIELLNSSFTKQKSNKIHGVVTEINNWERENDELGLQLTRKIYRMEGELSPTEIFIWTKIVGLIGDLANYAQKMANRMRLMLAK